MLTIKLLCILLVALVALGAVALLLDFAIAADDCSSAPRIGTRGYRVLTGCSYIVKFGMVLTAVALVGCLAPAGLGLAMAFAIPKPTSVPNGSWFDHSHNVATTLPFGAVVPVDWRFMLPGEKYKNNISGFCRALMLKAPAMQDVDLKYATYFVPTRLLCDKNEEIISEVSASSLVPDAATSDTFSDIIGKSSSPTSFPFYKLSNVEYLAILKIIMQFKASSVSGGVYFDFDTFTSALSDDSHKLHAAAVLVSKYRIGSLVDYLGFPVATDQQLNDIVKKHYNDSAATLATNMSVAPVQISMLPFKAYHAICNHFFVPDFQRRQASADNVLVDLRTAQVGAITDFTSTLLTNLRYSQYESDPYTCARSSGSINRIGSASSFASAEDNLINANTIRGMFALDEYARKIEYFFGDLRKQIKYMFGVMVSDRSALSPILVNAGSCPIGVSEIQNTSLDPVNSEQSSQSLGKMTAGFGKSYDTFEVEEHGVMMTCVWIRPRTSYMNRLPHMFRVFNSVDTIPNPLFSEIGEVSLSAYDVDYNPFGWMANPDSSSTKVLERSGEFFGYNSRYVEWKYTPDSFSGDFRGPLAYWHCAREFDEDQLTPDTSSFASSFLTAGFEFNLINGRYSRGVQPLNRIFTQVRGVPDVRPFQLQLRFNTQIWQLYPHIDDEL